MTEDHWPVCPGCGKRHPHTQDIYKAVLDDAFEEGEVSVDLSPRNLHTIQRACEKLKEAAPLLEGRVHAFYGEMTSALDRSNVADNDTFSYVFSLNNLALCLLALNEIGEGETTMSSLEEIAEVNTRINEALNERH